MAATNKMCELCTAFTDDIVHLDFLNERWLTKRDEVGVPGQFSYGYWGEDAPWYTFKHAAVEEMSRSAKADCNLCWLMLDSWKHDLDEDIKQEDVKKLQTWIEVLWRPLQLTSSFKLFIRSKVPFVAFEFFSLDDKIVTPADLSLRRALSVSATDENRFKLAVDWLTSCLIQHEPCERQYYPKLPTRVIDVGLEGDSKNPFLFVSNGETGMYVTLSHCWGKGERLVTLEKNLKEHQESLPLAEMPQTFKDAIEISRKIGMRYLWIDCYCIVQDSYNDWEAEAARMAEIYENAVFCLSAIDGQDSFAPMFYERLQTWQQRPVTLTNVRNADAPFHIGVRPKTDSVQDIIKASVLNERAWGLQERLLSPAVLHFSESYMFWECCSTVRSEADHYAEDHTEKIRPGLRQQWKAASPSAPVDLGLLWTELVKNYTARSLTYDKDKLPAILGLAKRFEEQMGDTFLAGLWKLDLHRQLLWHPISLICGDVYEPLKRPTEHFAPSWSWASVKGPIYYDWADEYPKVLRIPNTQHDCNFLQASVTASVPGGPCHGIIKLRGQIKEVRYQRLPGRMVEPGAGYIKSKTPDSTPYRPDNTSFNNMYLNLVTHANLSPEAQARALTQIPYLGGAFGRPAPKTHEIAALMDFNWEQTRECWCLRVTDWTQTGNGGQPLAYPHHLTYCLLLERVDTEDKQVLATSNDDLGTFRRIGVAADEPSTVEDFFRQERMSFLTLI
ncbi:MAG: hypothetical protein MMC33_001833 [Icmadophila ericetorum]|nr:hypothetical protein [Icmadophila ericetorum]